VFSLPSEISNFVGYSLWQSRDDVLPTNSGFRREHKQACTSVPFLRQGNGSTNQVKGPQDLSETFWMAGQASRANVLLELASLHLINLIYVPSVDVKVQLNEG